MEEVLYYFPPWRKQYFFSANLIDENRGFPLFYYPYSNTSKVFWFIWNNSRIFRKIFKVKFATLPKLFHDLLKYNSLLAEYYLQINLGTRGIEQKMTILAYREKEQKIFIKLGNTEISRNLLAHELKQLILIDGRLGVPRVLNSFASQHFSMISTEALTATKIKSLSLNNEIFNYIISIKEIGAIHTKNGMLYTFSHGDCCPWNFLRNETGKVILIDWEMANYFPAGYDLLTFIFQTHILLFPKRSIQKILKENRFWIDQYFLNLEITDWLIYFSYFVQLKIIQEEKKGNTILLKKWKAFNSITELTQ